VGGRRSRDKQRLRLFCISAGAKARDFFGVLAARLKSCPDTKRLRPLPFKTKWAPFEEVGDLIVYWEGAWIMHHLYTPFVVVPLIVVVFFSCILWATSTKEDGHSSH
jgi:hypothetical protein